MPIATWTPPEWVQLLGQFPIAALALVTLAIGVYWQRRWHREELQRNDGFYNDARQQVKDEASRAAADRAAEQGRHQSEIERLKTFYQEQIRLLQDRIRELEGRGGGRTQV